MNLPHKIGVLNAVKQGYTQIPIQLILPTNKAKQEKFDDYYNRRNLSMNKSKKIIFWVCYYILSLASFIIAFPITLFIFYPYSIIAFVVYAVAIVILSVFSFRKNAPKNATSKKVLFGVMLVPIIALLTILISIEADWLHYPG